MRLLKMKKLKGFTLVELIIVITILAILATIAIMSFQGYTKDARDSNRLATIKGIDTGLSTYVLKTWNYPTPENITGTGKIWGKELIKVGNISQEITRVINMNHVPLDPLLNTNYVYGISTDGKYYQIASVYENLQASTLINTTYADSYNAKVVGNYDGIIKYQSGSTCIANVPSLIFNGTGSVELTNNDIGYIVDKQANLPYAINPNSQKTTKTTTEILQSISSTGAISYECAIDKATWNTKKISLEATLWYEVDKIGQVVFWDTYYTEINPGGSTGWGTPPPAPPVCNYQQSNLDALNLAGSNNKIVVFDLNNNVISFPLTKDQWCNDVYSLQWSGGATILPEIFTLNLLTELHAVSQSITTLPAAIWNLTNLTKLTISWNLLTSLPVEIWNLTNLTFLDASFNQLASLPPEIWNLIILKELYIFKNQLSTLPVEIWNLTNLTHLHLALNQFTEVPAIVWSLNNLTYLSLRENILTTLPSNIWNLTKLTYLDISDDGLTALPNELWNITTLTSLNLSNNLFTSLPAGLRNLTNLESLELRNLSLNNISSSISNLTSLWWLDLGKNALTNIPAAIWNLNSLYTIYLDYNQLTLLPDEIWNLTNLSELDLTSNIWLWTVSAYYSSWDILSRTKAWASVSWKTITISSLWDDTPITITVEP